MSKFKEGEMYEICIIAQQVRYVKKILKLADIDAQLGNIDTALDNIIAIQESLIGGDA